MQGNLDKSLIVHKNELKTYCVRKMMFLNPGLTNSITDKLLLKTLIYIRGCIDTIKFYIEAPVNPNEVREYILSTAFAFILHEIEYSRDKV